MKIYLDNSATTKPLAGLEKLFEEYAEKSWYNPSARYAPAAMESVRLDEARKSVARLVSPEYSVIFTASGTESANTVIFGGARRAKAMHYVTDGVEHPAVYEAFMRLKEQGADVTFLETDRYGKVSPDDVVAAVRDDTALVSIMHVNNETGAVNDIEAISRAVKNKNPRTMFHADGVQAFARVYVRNTDNIDYYTASAHKIHALKGTGAVLFRKSSPLKAYIVGGGQETGLRSGTENTFGIYAFGYACDYFYAHRSEIAEKLCALKKTFLENVMTDQNITLVSPDDGADHIVCLSIKDVRGEVLLHSLEEDGIYISTGSACSSKKGVSRTAKSLGFSREFAEGIIRVSFSPFNTEEEAVLAAEKIKEKIQILSAFTRK